ncbi:MAG: HEAT repeat domain-containing protein, partial [Blastocatellia bacterium]
AVNDVSADVRRAAVSALVEHFREDEQTKPLLFDRAVNDADEYVRRATVSEMAEHFREDERTKPLLFDRAVNDGNGYVRSEATASLVEHFREDEHTKPLLFDRAVNDVSADVRSEATASLVEHFREDKYTKPLLFDHAVNDVSADVRRAAVSALVEHFREDERTKPLLFDHAINNSDKYIRSEATASLVEHFREDERTKPLLFDRAVNDVSADVRRAAVSALVEHFREDERTKPLLFDRAVNDADEYVRSEVINALTRHFRDDKQLFPVLLGLVRGESGASESIRIQAIKKLVRWRQNEPETLLLLNSLSDEDSPENLREAAKEAATSIRIHQHAGWVNWLNGIGGEDRFTELPKATGDFPVITARAIHLRNIRAFSDTKIPLNMTGSSNSRPMTLVLGDNAAGKSTLLCCLALAALGPEMANQVEKRPDSYLRHGAERGYIEVLFQLQLDPINHPEATGEFCIGLEIRKREASFRAIEDSDLVLGRINAAARLDWLRRHKDDRFGFVCGYGALRSFSNDLSLLLPEEPKEIIERVASLFRSSSLLMDPGVLGKMLDGDLSNFRTAVSTLPKDVSQALRVNLVSLLPDVSQINAGVSPSVTLNGLSVPIHYLSDGYGSMLALIGHLFRHGLSARNWKADPAQVFGMALIDEIDLHLHPSWQRQVLPDLRQVFPNIQIIATSHSPMVAGSIATDSIIVLRGQQVITDISSVEGWRADQILTSLLFDLPTTRDVETEKLLARYTTLLNERGPEDTEVQELGKRLSERMNMEAGGIVDKHTHKLLEEMLFERFKSLDDQTRKLVLAKAGLTISGGGA